MEAPSQLSHAVLHIKNKNELSDTLVDPHRQFYNVQVNKLKFFAKPRNLIVILKNTF